MAKEEKYCSTYTNKYEEYFCPAQYQFFPAVGRIKRDIYCLCVLYHALVCPKGVPVLKVALQAGFEVEKSQKLSDFEQWCSSA